MQTKFRSSQLYRTPAATTFAPTVIEDDNLPPDQQVAIPTEQDVSEGILIVAANGGS